MGYTLLQERNEQFEGLVALNPVETKRASDVIYDQILEMIQSGKLRPGDRLPPERVMMDMLHRSRPTVREALRMLEHAGYIRTIPGSNGAEVQQPNTRNAEQSLEFLFRVNYIAPEQMLEYREVNDTMLARWAAERRTPEDVAEMEKLLQKAETLLDHYNEFLTLDPLFHSLIAQAAQNSVAQVVSQVLHNSIANTIQNRMDYLTRGGQAAMCEKVLLQHQDILNAIANQNPDEAEQAMRMHLRALRQDLLLWQDQEEIL